MMEQLEQMIRRAGCDDPHETVALSRQFLLAKEMSAEARLTAAELLCRLVAAQDKPVGFRQLAAVLLLQYDYATGAGQQDYAIGRAAHAVAIYNMLADAGDGEACTVLEAMMVAADQDGVRDRILKEAKALSGVDLACA